MPSYVFRFFYTKSKVGVAPAATPTVTVVNGAGTAVVTGGAIVALAGKVGLYGYTYTNATPDDYVAFAITTDTTVDLAELPSWTPTVIVTNLDAAVSTRLAAASYSAAPTAEANADAVWDEALSGHTTTGTAGKTLATAGAATDPWLNEVPGAYVAPQSGYYISRLALNTVALTANFDPETKEMRYRYGDDYSAVETRSTVFTTLLDLTNGSVNWNVRTESGLVVVPCTLLGAHSYDLGPTAAQIMAVGVGVWPYDLEMSLSNGHTVTEIAGTVAIAEDVR
jgi:hypothetical protein